jgi:DNA polymerase III subunit gamma/tau
METSAAIPSHEVEQIRKQIGDTTEIQLHQVLTILLNEEKTIRYSSQPRIALEMTFIKICRLQPVLPVNTLIEKIDALKDRFLELDSRPGGHHGGKVAATVAAAHHLQHGFEPPGRLPDQPLPGHKESAPLSGNGHQPETNIVPARDQQPAVSASAAQEMAPAQAWEAILAIIDHQHPLLAANLQNSALATIHNNKLEIDIYGSKINMDILSQENNLATLKNICSTFYNTAMDVRLSHRTRTETTTQEQRPRPKPGVHPLVMDALDIFGGDIVNNRT